MSYVEIVTAPLKEQREHAEKQKKMILDVKKILDDNNISFFPFNATLLGFVKYRKAVLYDDDADFMVNSIDYKHTVEILSEFEKMGYVVKGSGRSHKYGLLVIHPKVFCHFKIDIAFFGFDKNRVVALHYVKPNVLDRFSKRHRSLSFLIDKINVIYKYFISWNVKRSVYPFSWFDGYTMIDVYGTQFKLINGFMDLIRMKYGPYWRDEDWEQRYLKYVTFKSMRYRIKTTDLYV